MKILAIIPARGGSKRLPGKNIRILGGKPLIAWTIEPAIQSGLFCDVLVSTDDPAIADVAKHYGAIVPWLRPEELATDTAGSVEVALHAIDWYEANQEPLDGIALLQPTSPFRSRESIKDSVMLFQANNGRSLTSFKLAESHPSWCFKIRKNQLIPFQGWNETNKRSQDLETAYVTDGSIYMTSPYELKANHSFLNSHTIPYIIKTTRESIDIDTEDDWIAAEKLLANSP